MIRRLNRRCFCTNLKNDYSTLFAVDISSTRGCISITAGAIHYSASLYIYFSIYKICICTGIYFSGSIANRNKGLIYSTRIRTPLVSIIQIYSGTTGKLHRCIRLNNQLCTGKHSNVLIINLNVSIIYVNCYITVDRQLIFFAINRCGTDRHLYRRYLHRTKNLNIESVSLSIIGLYNVTVCKIKHCTTLCKERNRC